MATILKISHRLIGPSTISHFCGTKHLLLLFIGKLLCLEKLNLVLVKIMIKISSIKLVQNPVKIVIGKVKQVRSFC